MSNFIVSARKYRPAAFDDVVGQDHVAKTLKNALHTDHVAHAFLFTGPRGVGKTTCARILAKIINCENPVNKTEACNQCNSCRAFNDNASFNIIELDAASNNSVENIRSLIEQVRFQPQNGKYKVFIIDEVHMLSQSAFNAFLKTLEEPPPYAVFILATTEKHKIIPTILSRCQIFDFRRIQVSDIVAQLEKICKSEGIKAEKEALHAIAGKADGAMRDALTIFDKISSSVTDVITYKDVVANLNLLDYEYYFRITDGFLREDLASVLITLNDVIKLGFDAEHFVGGLADHFRDVLIAKMPQTTEILDISDELKKRYIDQAAAAKSSFLLSGLSILNQCEIDLVRAKNKRLHIELALSKLTFLNHAVKSDIFGQNTGSQEKKTEVVSKKLAEESKKDTETPVPAAEKPKLQATPKPGTDADQQPPAENSDRTKPSNSTSKMGLRPGDVDALRESIMNSMKSKAAESKVFTQEKLREIWDNYANNNTSKSVKSALGHALLSLEGSTVHIRVPTHVAKDMIAQESPLLNRIRDEMDQVEMVFDIQVDKDKFPDFEENKPIQILTQKEKFVAMLSKNPNLEIFSKKMSLKLDSEV